MATFLSRTYIPQKQRQDTNFPLLAQVMQMKQGKYDANRAKIQQTLDAFGIQAQQVLREEDKEYMAAKLSSVTSQINEYGNRDLSQSGVTEDLMGGIKAAAHDPIIQNAFQNTQKYNNFQTGVAKLKEKNPELYSDINYQYALENAGLKDYMEGKTNTIGDLNYTPYNDYNKEINNNIIDLLGKQGKRTVQTRVVDANGNPTGEIQEVEIDGLSPAQLKSVAESMLSPQHMKQIEIDGWYNNGGFNNPAILENINGTLSDRTEEIEAEIVKSKNSLNGVSGSSKKAIETYIAKLNQEKVNITKNLEVLTKNPKAASTYLEKQKVINGITARFAPLYTQSNSIVKDDAYWAKMNYNLDLAKEQRLANKELQEQNKDVGDFSKVSKGTGELESLSSIENTIDTQLNTLSSEMDSTLNQIRYSLEREALGGNEQAEEQWRVLQKQLDNKPQGKSDTDIIRGFVLSMNSNTDPLILTNEFGEKENLKAKFRKLSDEYMLYTEGYQLATKKAKDRHVEQTLDTEQTFKAFNKNPNTKMLWNGRAVPVHQILKSEGLMDTEGNKIGDLKNKPKLLQELQKSYYASDILNDLSPIKFFEGSKSLTDLAVLLGETPSSIITSENTGAVTREGNPIYRTSINSNTKTGQFLLQAQSNKIYDTAGFSDQDLSSDDSDIGRFIKTDYKDDPIYRQDLERFRDRLGNQQQIGFSYDSNKEEFNSLVRTAQNKNTNFERNENSTVSVRQEGQEVIIFSKNKTVGGEDQGVSETRLSINEFQNDFPQLSQQLNFASEASIYTYDRLGNKPLISEPIKYIENTSEDLYEWAKERVLTGAKTRYMPYLTTTDTKTKLLSTYPDLQQKLPDFNNVVNEIVNESSSYAVHLKFTGDFGKPKLNLLLIDKANGKPINTLSIDNTVEADDFKEILDETPQVYYGLLIENLFEKQRQHLLRTNTSSSEYIKLIESLNNK